MDAPTSFIFTLDFALGCAVGLHNGGTPQKCVPLCFAGCFSSGHTSSIQGVRVKHGLLAREATFLPSAWLWRLLQLPLRRKRPVAARVA